MKQIRYKHVSTLVLAHTKRALQVMFMNKLKYLCTPILTFSFATGFVFASENQAVPIPNQDKKDETKKDDKSFDQFQSEIIDVLKKLDPNPTNKEEYEKVVRKDLYKIVDKFSEKLRPDMGSKKYVSADKTFVLLIAANGTGDNPKGEKVKVIDDDAKIVVALGGDGVSFEKNKSRPRAGSGGSAVAIAKKGVIVALGGRGGVGEGNGGGAAGRGDIGAIVLDGERGVKVPGKSAGGQGGAGGVSIPGGSEPGITNAKAIINALKSP